MSDFKEQIKKIIFAEDEQIYVDVNLIRFLLKENEKLEAEILRIREALQNIRESIFMFDKKIIPGKITIIKRINADVDEALKKEWP